MTVRIARRLDGIERTMIREIFDSAPADAINLGLGQPDLPTPPPVALAGTLAVAEGRTGYTTTAGNEGLRAAVAGDYAPFAAGPEDVVIHVGSQEALFACALALLDPGDELLVPDPGYPAYPTVARLVGAGVRSYPLRAERGFRLVAADVVGRLTDRTRAVVLCSPGNPTGAVHPAAELARLARALESREVAWISDEIYDGFHYTGPVPSIRETSPAGGVVVSGLSKTLSMTGWRIGWVVAPGGLAQRITAVHQYLVTCASSVSQAAALVAFGAEGRAWAERYRRTFARRREVMGDALARIPGLRVRPPDGAFYFFVDVRPRAVDSLELARRALERGVVTIPGEAFGDNGKGFLRLSFAATEADIVEGVRRLGDALSA